MPKAARNAGHRREATDQRPKVIADRATLVPRDPVATILEQWQRERPDLDPAPMRMFGLLARTHYLATSHLNDRLARWEISRASFDVLAALRRAGSPFNLTPKQLSQSLMLSGAGMTSRLDRLEALFLIARLPDTNDRRSMKIQLTHRGVKLIDEIIPEVVQAQWNVAANLGAEATQALIDTLTAFSSALAKGSDD